MLPRLLLPVLALAVSLVGMSEFMLAPMLTPLAEAFGTSPSHATLLVSGYALSYTAAAPLSGWLSDRIDRRRLILAALLLLGLDGAAVTVAPNLDWAVVLRVLGGLASAFLIPTAAALIADLVPGERQAAAMGRAMFGMTLGIAAGPSIAGLLTDAFGWRAPFIASAVACFLVFAVARAVLPVAAHRHADRRSVAFGRLASPRLAVPLVAKGAWNGSAVAGFLIGGEILRARFDLGTGEIGAAVWCFGLGLGIGNLAVGRLMRLAGRAETVLMLAIFVILAALATFMLAPLPLAGSLACLTLWGTALGIAAPSSTAILATRAGSDRGFVLAVSESLNNLALLALAPIAASLLVGAGHAAAAMVLAGTLSAAAIATAIDRRRQA